MAFRTADAHLDRLSGSDHRRPRRGIRWLFGGSPAGGCPVGTSARSAPASTFASAAAAPTASSTPTAAATSFAAAATAATTTADASAAPAGFSARATEASANPAAPAAADVASASGPAAACGADDHADALSPGRRPLAMGSWQLDRRHKPERVDRGCVLG